MEQTAAQLHRDAISDLVIGSSKTGVRYDPSSRICFMTEVACSFAASVTAGACNPIATMNSATVGSPIIVLVFTSLVAAEAISSIENSFIASNLITSPGVLIWAEKFSARPIMISANRTLSCFFIFLPFPKRWCCVDVVDCSDRHTGDNPKFWFGGGTHLSSRTPVVLCLCQPGCYMVHDAGFGFSF